ncbi:MAG: hypothetical protein UY81_C0013G0003 [Candidatus Giovannonibacteria bacterium GW2011_GWA2_53_7]|uniref:DUF4215 domain-containing protein n=1 Tax=Candidatus Giovannonibacteria bacterium GW2011_GWA2_53_7 TaxID=1618650 RepID=A0A0G1Y0W7_9BACT|nr:MAG: hypothetical protein UY81_C0013G0003 [Candidatus Giovannonibacteria bacterium GW2011_GWA2_53_7]
MRSRILFSLLLFVGSVLLWLPGSVFAQTLPETGLSEFAAQVGLGGTSDIRLIIARLIRTALSLAGIVLVAMIVYAGFLWMTARGAQDKIDKARQTIFRAVVGLIIVFSAFAITQFVVSSLMTATGATSTSSSTTGGPIGCPTCPVDTNTIFVTESWGCLETLPTLPKNTQVQILFNRNVSTDDVYLMDFVTVRAGSSLVGVDLNGGGQTVTITPNSSTCPAEPGNMFCPGTDYHIVISEGFLSLDGAQIQCTLSNPCFYDFTTNDTVDNDGPTVVINTPTNGAPVFSFTPLDLQAVVTDNGGVGITDFTVNSAIVDSVEPTGCTGEGPMSCLANGAWTPGNLAPASTHVIRATATDCSGNTKVSDAVTVTTLALHCANEIRDEDETAIDCGGGDCLACSGSSCTVNSDCASFLCVNNQCVTGPKILNVSPRGDAQDTPALRGVPNGAPGNFLTITGTGFGTTPGIVTFLGADNNDGDNRNASVVSCPTPSWSNTQIVVAIPPGVIDGPMQVTTSGSTPLVDATDDTYGPFISNFVPNQILRPGLCAVTPALAEASDRIAISGVHFGTDPTVGHVYFSGNNVYEATFLSAIDSWADQAVSVLVPPSTAGDYDLSIFVDGEGSNPLEFEVTDALLVAGAPRIDYVDSGVFLCVGDLMTEGDLCSVNADCGTGGTCVSAPSTGAPGQYVTIFGDNFGSTVGIVLFADGNSGDVTFVPDFPAQCSNMWWNNTSIVVQVPAELTTDPVFNPKTIRVRRSTFLATSESNAVNFTVDAIGVTPGLCALSPSAGPVGTPVTFFGDNLGETATDFVLRFYNGADLPPSLSSASSTEVFTSDQQIGGAVPAGAVTGPVLASVEAISSNTLPFLVGNCNVVENLCTSAQVCCASGVCANNISACAGDVVNAQYVYRFTTGPIPNFPTVIEECASYSPSPSTLWIDGQAGCVNADVHVAFAPGAPAFSMNSSTLLNQNNVVVDQCVGNGIDPCEATLVNAQNNQVHVAGVLSATPATVTFNPTINLLQNTWYRVTITSGVTNSLGVALEDNYGFRFKTRNDATECVVEDLLVSPNDYTAVTSSAVDYEALPTNGSCQVLDPDDYTYDWTLSNYGLDIVFPGDVTSLPGVINEIQVLPNEETNAGQPALVSAGVVGFVANDVGDLTVNFLDPYVTESYPTCTTACVNASVGASFNTAMTSGGTYGVPGAHVENTVLENNVRLFRCSNELCDVFIGSPLLAPVVFVDDPLDTEDDGRSFFLNIASSASLLSSSLSPSSYYRAMIWGGIESAPGPGQPNGVPLWGEVTPLGVPVTPLNYGNYYSWTFRTRANATACGIGSVDVTPSQLLLGAVGARGAFSAEPFGEPDSCSLNGQRLNPLSYPWNWILNTIANPLSPTTQVLIASFLPNHGPSATLDTSSASGSTCTNSCTNAGSTAYEAVCGNGVIDRTPGTEAWEDCDPTAPGWSSAECTSNCQTIGVTACDSTITTGCCGNGNREGREECDDGDNQNNDGCSAVCLKEGSRSMGLTCGDGQITYDSATFAGEECDQSGNVISGDGCSSICLREGSINTSVIGGVICGDGVIGAGEDCDDDNIASGDGCSASCLQEPLFGTWTIGSVAGVCGNGTLEPALTEPVDSHVGEECDDGNTRNGDGCSAGCLTEGSSIFYAVPSFCGDGVTTFSSVSGGEECEVTVSDDTAPYDPVQYVEIEPVASQTVVDGVASTTLQATGTDASTSTSALGTAVIGLTCSCTTDASCGSTTAIGCGMNGCCFERPEVDAGNTYPLTSTNNALCRNTLVQVRFTDQMSIESLFAGDNNTQPQVFLELLSADGDWVDANGNGLYEPPTDVISGPVDCPSSYLAFDTGATNRFSRFFRRLVYRGQHRNPFCSSCGDASGCSIHAGA